MLSEMGADKQREGASANSVRRMYQQALDQILAWRRTSEVEPGIALSSLAIARLVSWGLEAAVPIERTWLVYQAVFLAQL